MGPASAATLLRVAWCLLLAYSHAVPIVVSGATGRVGSAVVRALVSQHGTDDVFILARDAQKARALHGDVQCLNAAYDDDEALSAALASVPAGFHLFLACSNGPAQAALESSVCRAAHANGCSFVVKLSTATPVLEMKQGGPYAAHLAVEELLSELAMPHAVLRPSLFLDEVCFGSFLGVCGALRTADACSHPFAASPIAAVDVRDVADCAAALLCTATPESSAFYEVTGAAAISLGTELTEAISELRPRPVQIAPCTADEFVSARGLPAGPAAANLAGFLTVLSTECAAVSDTVTQLTGHPPRSVTQFVHDHAARFLPESFSALLGSPATSFRAGARVAALSLADQLDALAPDEVRCSSHTRSHTPA
jgi:uncharacterized protein YbjT (DUF2867 family)